MEIFVQQLINGLTLGSIYGLIAIGYTMVFGIIGMVNFAHGDVFMLSAFIALIFFLILTTWLGIVVARAGAAHRAGPRDGAHLAVGLGHRAPRLPAAARLVPPGAADLGHRHVDLPVELRAGRAGRRATSRFPRCSSDVIVLFAGRERLRRHPLLQADHHRGRDGGAARDLLVPRAEDARSAARSAPASRTARWRRCSASTSTAPSRSPS